MSSSIYNPKEQRYSYMCKYSYYSYSYMCRSENVQTNLPKYKPFPV